MKKISLVLISVFACLFFSTPSFSACKPDLVVSDIRLTLDCKIEVTITNNSSVGVPNTAYVSPGSALQMYKDGQPWGGLVLFLADPQRLLQNPYSSVKHIWFPQAANLKLSNGNHQLQLTVDKNNVVDEDSEQNNILTRQVNCKLQSLPLDAPTRIKKAL